MNFDQIFEAYYNLYLLESETPDSADDEYIIALRLANEAVSRWENYDGTYWQELFTTRVASGDGAATITAGTTDYAAPADFKEAGGHVKLIKDGSTVGMFPIIQPQEAQFRKDESKYAYFTGNASDGFTLKLNPIPTANIEGATIEYVYYRLASRFARGSDATEMPIPYFVVYRMLANRFRGSRNPYYQTALQEAEDSLKTMLLMNSSGSWADPWKLPDNSGTTWGL